jgi:Mn-dependent DtxR family transcriptional regulator
MRKLTIEEYVEVIYSIQEVNDIVHTNDVALKLGVNPASVTEMFIKLNKEGYLNYERYSGVTLTNKGKKIAVMLKNRHETLKHFLELLGVDKDIANDDACKIEHTVHPKTVEKLKKFVDFAEKENFCNKWLDHFRYFDETGKFIKCSPKDNNNCSVHK